MMSTTIVVPCFNEASRLPTETYLEFLDTQTDVRFLFVDDGSEDGTHDVLQELCESSSGRCEFLRLPENKGKAEAVRQGILQALDTDAALVGFWDADLAIPLDFSRLVVREPGVLLLRFLRTGYIGRDFLLFEVRKPDGCWK